MQTHRIAATQRLAVPQDEAWAFFSDPENLREITPPDLDFQVRVPLPPAIHQGLIVAYTIRPFLGRTVGWLTEITTVDEPRYFVDEQRMGPFALWHHQHTLTAVDSGTEVRDLVTYAMRGDPVSRPLHGPVVQPRLRQIFAYRRHALARRFGELPGDRDLSLS